MRRRRMLVPPGACGMGKYPGIGMPLSYWAIHYMERIIPSFGMDEMVFKAAISLLGKNGQQGIIGRYEQLAGKTRPAKDDMDFDFGFPIGNPGYVRIAAKLFNMASEGRFPGGKAALLGFLLELLKSSGNTLEPDRRRFAAEFERLGKALRLETGAMEFIRFLFVFRHISELDELINGRQMVGTLVSLFGAASGLDTRTVCNLLASRGPLFASGALIDAGMTDCSDFQLSAPLEEYLSGLSKTPFFEGCLQRDEGDRYPLETFTVAGQALCDLLSGPGPVHILLYGKPGTGKTEFARAAVAAAGRGAFFLRHDLEDANQSRLLSVTAGVTRTAHEDGVLVIDEADELLATSPFGIAGRNRGEKARMNDLLDGIPVKTIWITNRTGCIDDSTLRRFHYSIEFTDFSRKQRILLWHNRSRKHPFARILDASLIARLAADFPVDAGPIGTALDALPRLVRKTSGGRRRPRAELRAATENALRDLLSRHCRLAGVALRPRPNGRSETYDPAALVLDTNREQLVANLENWQVSMDALPNREQSGLALLFHGLPGTGKTAFAGHLAGVLGRELVVKRASDLLSCYVGETEHNISRAFHQAEEQRSLLLIDEADSFLNERAGARHSWEVSSVNEFLTQMEIFHGLLVCSTNLLDRIDAASLRRFHWKIKFLPLDGKGKTRLFTRFFPQAAARLGSRLAQDLAGCGALTPGDFHAVAERFRFGNVLPEPECLIRALSDESRIRETACGRKPVGFRPQA